MSFARSNTCGMCHRPCPEFDHFCSDGCEEEYQERSEADAPYSRYAPARCGYCDNPVPPGEDFCCQGCELSAHFDDMGDALDAVLDASTERRAA